MKYDLIIVRYSEIGLKGRATRRHFENTLVSNIRKAFRREQASFLIKREWGRIYVYCKQLETCILILKKIFGISSLSPAVKTQGKMETILNIGSAISKIVLNRDTRFAVRVSRTGDHEFTSQEVAVKLGSAIVGATNAQVDLTNPDYELFVEIRGKDAYLFTEKIQGPGGLPLGTQGNVIAVISDKKSILAAWYMMKRGCRIFFVNVGETTHSTLKSFITHWYTHPDIYTVDEREKIYEILHDVAQDKNCRAVITGYSLYENSQIILSDFQTLKKRCALPILSPLIAMDEEKINLKCKDLGINI